MISPRSQTPFFKRLLNYFITADLNCITSVSVHFKGIQLSLAVSNHPRIKLILKNFFVFTLKYRLFSGVFSKQVGIMEKYLRCFLICYISEM